MKGFMAPLRARAALGIGGLYGGCVIVLTVVSEQRTPVWHSLCLPALQLTCGQRVAVSTPRVEGNFSVTFKPRNWCLVFGVLGC